MKEKSFFCILLMSKSQHKIHYAAENSVEKKAQNGRIKLAKKKKSVPKYEITKRVETAIRDRQTD